jgi:hypothetical protein
MQQFLEFIDRKQRESVSQLKIVSKALQKGKLDVKEYLHDDDPHIFVRSHNKKLSFEGVRVYKIGDQVAYRIQKLEKSEPFGKTYALNLEDMFNDYLSEGMTKEEAGDKVIESMTEEIKKFFKRSAKAEEELRTGQKDGLGLIIKTGGSDYSSTVLNRA